ncbi:MAG TPA: N-acetylmuramoyl-L-alanine amidase [Actinomycetota bacterium]|nr:N-acetylmuramoyl-L-alanine amidase [Actinomycetota bacterium]
MNRKRRTAVSLSLLLLALGAPVAETPGKPDIDVWSLPASGGVVKAGRAFSLLGVAWPRTEREPASVQVRTSRDGVAWTPWTTLEILDGEGPDQGTELGPLEATAPLWVGGARLVDVRYSGKVPPGATLQLVDPGPDPGPSMLSNAHAETAAPGIVSRAAWGANESMRRGSPRYSSELRTAFVHHTVTGNDYGRGDSAKVVRSIYAYHVQSNGWDDIGYNFLVDRFGQVFEGRAGGVQHPVVGAHAQGFNSASVGVSFIGTFSNVSPPAVALNAAEDLLAWKLDLHHVDPRGRTTVTSGGSNKFAEGQRVDLPVLAGHRDVGHTDCPGGALYAEIPYMRDEIFRVGLPKLFDPSFGPSPFTPGADGVRDSVTTSITASSPGNWSLTVYDAGGRRVRQVAGSGGGTVTVAWDGRDDLAQPVRHGYYLLRWHLNVGGAEARLAEKVVLLASWPNGTFIKEPRNPLVSRVVGGTLRPVISPEIYLSHASWQDVAVSPGGSFDSYPGGAPLPMRDGTLIIYPSSRGYVYIVTGGVRRAFATEQDFVRGGFRWESVRWVPDSTGTMIPEGPAFDPAAPHVDGTLIKGSSTMVWLIQNGLRRPIPSEGIYLSWAFGWGEIVNVQDSQLLLYAEGPALGFRDGSLIGTPDGRVWVISEGQRRYISGPTSFQAFGYDWRAVRPATDAEAAHTPRGGDL